MRRALAFVILIASVLASASAPAARAQELAFETYTGLGWTITWDPKVVQLDSVSELKYTNSRAGCNLALDYPRFSLCARSMDHATYSYTAPSQYDQRISADNVQQMRDTFFPDSEPVPDELTSRPAFESDERASQLFVNTADLGVNEPIRNGDALYIEVRRLSPDEMVTLVITGLTFREFEAAENEVDTMLASIEVREPTFTDPNMGWSIAWDHEVLRPSAIPDPDPETSFYLTEYTTAYEADGLEVDIWMADFDTGANGEPALLDPVLLLNQFFETMDVSVEDADVEFPEGYESLETSGPDRASGVFPLPIESPFIEVAVYWGLIDILVLVPGEALLVTLIVWDADHSEELLPVFEEFLDSITVP